MSRFNALIQKETKIKLWKGEMENFKRWEIQNVIGRGFEECTILTRSSNSGRITPWKFQSFRRLKRGPRANQFG